MSKCIARFFLLFVLALGFAPHAAKANPLGYCEAIAQARHEMPLLFIQSNCADANRQVMYGAAAAVNHNNAAGTQATLGMLQVETGCGTAQPGTAGCDGTYGARAQCSGCTAYGAGQIISGTWQGLTTGQNANNTINQLGGCSGVTPGSLLDDNVTRNGTVRGQFVAFRNALCQDRANGTHNVASNQARWGAMSGVSVLVANQLDGRANVVLGRNPGATTQLTNLGLNAQEVAFYATHNLGEGRANNSNGAGAFLSGLANNPNASVASGLSSQVLRNNWGLYCTNSSCSQPLTYAQAAQRMSASMRRGNCVNQGMAALGMPVTGTVPVSPNGVYAQSGVNTQAGLDAERARIEWDNAGGPAGQISQECAEQGINCSSGSSVYPRNDRSQGFTGPPTP